MRLLNSLIKTKCHVDIDFHCEYGKNIFVGNKVIINMNCTFEDNNRIDIGNNVNQDTKYPKKHRSQKIILSLRRLGETRGLPARARKGNPVRIRNSTRYCNTRTTRGIITFCHYPTEDGKAISLRVKSGNLPSTTSNRLFRELSKRS